MNEYQVDFFWDDEANVWLVKLAAPELIELNNLPKYDSLLLNVRHREKMVYA